MNETYEVLIKLLLAMLIGGIIGFERQSINRPAGLKTHILVTLGATLVMIISVDGFVGVGDPARLAAQVVSGVGFLGTGTILVRGRSVSGLTTAATLWVCACIGLAIGIGFYKEAFISLSIVLIALWPINYLQKIVFKEEKTTTLIVKYKDDIELIDVYDIMKKQNIKLEFIEKKSDKSEINLTARSHSKSVLKLELLKHKNIIGFEEIYKRR